MLVYGEVELMFVSADLATLLQTVRLSASLD
jgi:hypothetical protein